MVCIFAPATLGGHNLREESVLTPRVIGIVSAPLWDSKSSTFAGLLTTSDYINVIQYYFQNPAALDQIDQFRLDNLRGPWNRNSPSRYALRTNMAIQRWKRHWALRLPRQFPLIQSDRCTRPVGVCSSPELEGFRLSPTIAKQIDISSSASSRSTASSNSWPST